MKVLASYLLSLSSRPILPNVHRIGLSFSSRFSRSICTSNIAFTHSSICTSTIFPPLEQIITDNHQLETSKVYNCISTWTIQNFELLHGTKLESKAFSPKDLNYEWIMKLSNGKGNSWHDSSLDLALKPSEKAIQEFGGASGKIEFALIDAYGVKRYVKRKPFIVETTGSEVLMDEFIKQTDLLHEGILGSFLYNGALTIYCQVSFVLIKQIKTNFEIAFGRYFNNKESSDLTIEFLWKQFPAHKFVLAARSPVFKEMFERDAVENRQRNKIFIRNVKEDAGLEMLRFIYTGKVEMENLTDTKSKFSLFFAADKYDIKDLKILCEKELENIMSKSDDVAKQIRILARKHNLRELEAKAKSYSERNGMNFVLVLGMCACIVFVVSEILRKLFELVAECNSR